MKRRIEVGVQETYRRCAREVVAQAASVARWGRNETRAFDSRALYLVDDGEGAFGALSFQERQLVGLSGGGDTSLMISLREPGLPDECRQRLSALARLPFVESRGLPTALLWSEGESIVLSQAEADVLEGAAYVFQREFLNDSDWLVAATEYYGAEQAVLALCIELSLAVELGTPPPVLGRRIKNSLLVGDAGHAADATAQLVAGGVFSLDEERE